MENRVVIDPGFCSRTALVQLCYGVWVSLTMVNIGLALNFPAVTIPQLKEPSSAITITLSEEAWIASVLTLASPLGCVVCGYLMDRFGRKLVLLLSEVPTCAGWIYTGLAPTAKDIIIGRVLVGLGMGMMMGAPRIYVTEITLPNMRGVVGAFPNLALSFGITLLAALGIFLEWKTICYVAAGYSILLFFTYLFLPETPYYVLMKSNEREALKTLKVFRSAKYDASKEMEDMVEYKFENNIRRLSFCGQMKFLVTRAAWKPFCIVFVYLLISQLAGITIMFTWTVDLLKSSKSSVDPNVGNLILGLTRFFTSIVCSILMYRMGRKPQALLSGAGVGFVCIFLGSYLHSNVKPTVVPQISFTLYVVFATLGYYTLPLLIMYELYPLQVRGLLGGITTCLLSLLVFGVNKLYPYLRDKVGHNNIILIFGISSLLGCIYLYLYLPETKGLTLQEIEEFFNERRSTLVSQRKILALKLSATREASKSASKLTKPKKPGEALQLGRKYEDGSSTSKPEEQKDGEQKKEE